jgi:hypothetical protein
MSYFAKCEATSEASKFLVTEVIAADQAFVDTQPGMWVQTSYNTYGNVHYAPSPPAEPHTPDGGTPLRANYAGIGYTLDESVVIDGVVGVFYAPQPYPSWTLDPATYLWIPPNPPGPAPTDGGQYIWDEATLSWVLANPQF